MHLHFVSFLFMDKMVYYYRYAKRLETIRKKYL